MADEAEVPGVELDELLDFLREHGGDQLCWKQCRLWRDENGVKKMCQPAMEHLLQDIKGVGRDRRTNARIPKSEWDLGKVSKALKKFATDDYAEMSAAQRKEKFVNIAPGGSPFMTVNSSFTLKMLNGEQDESYTGSMPQHMAWEHHYQKDLMCLKPEEEAVALYLNLLPRADNGAARQWRKIL